MRATCSLILSVSLLFPNAVLASTQTTQDKNAKQAAPEPQPVAPFGAFEKLPHLARHK